MLSESKLSGKNGVSKQRIKDISGKDDVHLQVFNCNIYLATASHFLLVMLSLLFLSHLYFVCAAYLIFTGPVDLVFERL